MTVVVELDHVSRRYVGPPETVALSECSLKVNEADFMTIVGPSGSGKSTLLNLVGLLDRPTSGTYRLLGDEVSSLDENGRAALRGANIGFVFQSFQLLERRTCVENVMLADLYNGVSHRRSRERAEVSLNSVGLGSRVMSLPVELSGGERQRLAIARALVGGPAIMLCDEPTGNLDSRNAEIVLELLLELNREGATIMLITHDAEIARLGNRRLAILDGVVQETDIAAVAAS